MTSAAAATEHRRVERTQYVPEVDIDSWNEIFEINVTATVRGIQTCAPLIKDSGGGAVVLIGSVAGITGNFSTAYSASKWALEGVARSAAYVYADWGIRCNVIQPGFIETDMTAKINSNPDYADDEQPHDEQHHLATQDR